MNKLDTRGACLTEAHRDGGRTFEDRRGDRQVYESRLEVHFPGFAVGPLDRMAASRVAVMARNEM